ncbi:MAG: hypothetical protein HYS08_06110 [Chlamydiae bacterium]|nr:hypothetical protein [Chlamydiota bacterium]MBI3266467.1 hypothetical protein [Chlamydiota bacterium]
MFFRVTILIFFLVFQAGEMKNFSHLAFSDEHVLVLGEEFQLKMGGTVAIPSENLKMMLKSIPSDSRCPEGAECIWAGQVKVLVHVEKDGQDLGDHTLALPMMPKNKSPEVIGGCIITLSKVEPYPKMGQKIEPSDYVASFVVTKA